MIHVFDLEMYIFPFKCDSWKAGTNPHCNAYSKNAFWEKLRKMAKRKTVLDNAIHLYKFIKYCIMDSGLFKLKYE